MSKHALTLAANVKQTVPGGFFIKVMESSTDLDVRLYDQEGRQFVNAEDVGQGDGWNVPQGFGFAEIESATGQSVVIQVLPVVMSSSNLVGDVNALSVPKNNSKSATEFIGGFALAAVAGQFNHVMLWNPVGSGVVLDVRGLTISAVNTAYVQRHNSIAAPAAWANASGAGIWSGNKDLYGAAPNGLIYTLTNAATFATYLAPVMSGGFYNAVVITDDNAPFVLGEGEGLAVTGRAVNQAIETSYEWSERAP